MNVKLQLKALAPFLTLSLLISCMQSPNIRFLEPQPKNKRNLASIPHAYRGEYICLEDSSYLSVDSKSIIQHWSSVDKVIQADLQQDYDTSFTEDAELDFMDNLKMKFQFEGDSVKVSMLLIDTIFNLSDKMLLRTYKGYLFLNYPNEDSTWAVKTLKLESDSLAIEKLVRLSDIDSLKAITPILEIQDTSANRVLHYDLKPKRKELKGILKRKEEARAKFVRVS